MTTPGALQVVVVGTADDRLVDLGHEISRVRGALLYGDTVELVSPKIVALDARMLWKMRTLPKLFVENLNDAQARDATSAIAAILAEHQKKLSIPEPELLDFLVEAPEILAELLRDRGPDQVTEASLGLNEVAVANYLRRYPDEEATSTWQAVKDLIRLRDEGILAIDTGGALRIATSEFVDVDAALVAVLDDLVSLLESPTGREHPLLSSHAIVGLRERLAGGDLVNARFSYANRAEIAARLIAIVPGFPDADLDELLDLRVRIAPQLAAFRSAVADLEDAVGTSVIDPHFDAAFQDVYLREVAPALAALEESLEEEGAYPALLRGVPKVAAGMVALGTAIAVDAPQLAGATALAAGALSAAADELLTRRRARVERKRNRLFLLFEAANALGR